MEIKFKIAKFESDGKITLLEDDYDTYPEAEKDIATLPHCMYQIQKVYIVY